MPYDAAEGIRKFHVVDANGKWKGGFYTPDKANQPWTGRPQNISQEFLYQTKCGSDIFYIILYRYRPTKYPDQDYCKVLTDTQAADWFVQEGYDLPDDLKQYTKSYKDKDISQTTPLSDAQLEVWNLLENTAMSAKEIARALGSIVSPEAIVKRISAIKKSGRDIQNKRGRGYWRPDALPLDDKRASADSE